MLDDMLCMRYEFTIYIMTMPPTPYTAYSPGISVTVCGRNWNLQRAADLETLWQAMVDSELNSDERLPYWTELWPASIALAEHIQSAQKHVKKKRCLDLGCGLGLTALVGAWLGAHVVGMDYEPQALAFAARNTQLNHIPLHQAPLWTAMDWRHPALKRYSMDVVWGGDIMYEKRFVEPVLNCIDHVLAPHGRAWLAEPGRNIYTLFQAALDERGWHSRLLRTRPTLALYRQQYTVPVRLWEITRTSACTNNADTFSVDDSASQAP